MAALVVAPAASGVPADVLAGLLRDAPEAARLVILADPAGPVDLPVPVTWIRPRPGVGTAAVRNQVLRFLAEPVVAFLGPGASPEPGWLGEAVRALDERPWLSAVAPWTGRAEPRVTVSGLPGLPRDQAVAGDVLYPPLDATVARVGHLRSIGGFDESLTGGALDVDVGWRLWLAGGAVRSCPESRVRLPDAPAGPDDLTRRYADGLATAYTCYVEERAEAALASATALAPPGTDAEALRRALDLVAARLPALRERRREVQEGRKRADHELMRLLVTPEQPPPPPPGRDLQLTPGESAAATSRDPAAAAQLFGPRRRVLVVTDDTLAAKMAGPAIRAWHIAEALAAEHDVCLATTSPICERSSDRFAVEAVDRPRMAALEAWCDVVVLQGYVMVNMPALAATKKVMVVDVYDPIHLEALELYRRVDEGRRAAEVRSAVAVLNHQLIRGDFFICASAKQRDLWIGHLGALNRVNPVTYEADPTLRRLVDVVPFGLVETEARHERPAIKGVVPGISRDDEVILWAGGIYNWFDPLTLIRAVELLRRRRPRVRLFFMGVRHPNPGVVAAAAMAEQARRLAGELDLTGRHVFFNETWVDYDERQSYLLEADLGVSTHFEHVETAFSFRTRMLDYLWAGTPMVSTGGDAFSDLIEREGLGVVVPPEDPVALEAALFRLLDDRELATLCRKNIERIRPHYAWSATLAPLLRFCRDPRRAPDQIGVEPLDRLRSADPPLRRLVGDLHAAHQRGGLAAVASAAAGRLRRRVRRPR